MQTLIYDKTWAGFLTTVFEIYERKLDCVTIYTQDHVQQNMFGGHILIVTDEQKAKRVLTGLSKKVSAKALKQLYACFLSELRGIENTLLSYIQLAFQTTESPEQAYAHPDVLKVSQTDKMVHREKHRMEAFIRFQLTKDGIFFATITPDFNVIPLIIKHFKDRYADQKWIIYDIRRYYGVYYDLNTVEEVSLNFNQPDRTKNETPFHVDEDLYQSLWKDYFKHVNITERKNTKLHLQHVPKRYWRHLTEKMI